MDSIYGKETSVQYWQRMRERERYRREVELQKQETRISTPPKQPTASRV